MLHRRPLELDETGTGRLILIRGGHVGRIHQHRAQGVEIRRFQTGCADRRFERVGRPIPQSGCADERQAVERRSNDVAQGVLTPRIDAQKPGPARQNHTRRAHERASRRFQAVEHR